MELELIRMFVKVVQQGSFSKAADNLRIPKSTVSKAVSRLERETGTKLLLRTTRSLTLTAAGRAFYETCLSPIQTLEDARKSLQGQDSVLSGFIKLTAPEDLGTHVIAPVIGELSRKHPQLSFELNYTDEIIDLVKDGYDLAVRIGKLRESSLKVKRVGDIQLVLVASPKYLKSSEKIRSPRDLETHDMLSMPVTTRQWILKSKRETAQVHIKTKIVSNQMTSLLRMAVAGAGIALVPSYLCEEQIKKGHVEHVLTEWNGGVFPVSILSPVAAGSTARLKIVVDQLGESIKNSLKQKEGAV